MTKKQKTTKKPTSTSRQARVVTNTQQSGLSGALRSKWAAAFYAFTLMVIGVGTLIWTQAATANHSLWTTNAMPKTSSYNDPKGVTVGTKFTSQYAGKVVGMRFYKGSQNTDEHVGYLWTADGRQLASVTFKNETTHGWQTASFSNPST